MLYCEINNASNYQMRWINRLLSAIILRALYDLKMSKKKVVKYGKLKNKVHNNDALSAWQFLANSELLRFYCSVLKIDARKVTEKAYELYEEEY